jgi:hypothetical protein
MPSRFASCGDRRSGSNRSVLCADEATDLRGACPERVVRHRDLDDLPDHGSLEMDLVDLAGALASFITSPAGMGVIRTVFADGETPQTRRLAKSMWSAPTRMAPRLVLERAFERGELRPDADLDLLLHTIGGAVLHREFVERRSADARWARRLIRLLAQGVTPRR